jgi:hypothetical protein
MSPYRIRKEEVELLAKHGRVESRVCVETRSLVLEDTGFQNRVNAHLESTGVRLDTAITACVKQVDQPIARTKDPTS